MCPHLPTQGWGTLLLAQGGIVLNLLYTAASRSPVLTVLLMLVSGALLMVTGMWLTLQFRFIQMQYPAVVLAFERQVLTASIPVAAIMQVRGAARERGGAEGQTPLNVSGGGTAEQQPVPGQALSGAWPVHERVQQSGSAPIRHRHYQHSPLVSV